jgi:TorA maturation chaperone TorD
MPDPGLEAIGASRGIANTAGIYAGSDDDSIENALTAGRPHEIDDVDLSRANEYRLLAHLLRRAPSPDLLADIAKIQGDTTELGRAHAALAAAAAITDANTLSREHFDLFIGVGRGELLPYASYYLTGFLQERPLAKIRDDMVLVGIAQDEASPEPEDHIAILCEIMAGMASRRFEVDLATERRFFQRHLKPWASHFFSDLETAASAGFYRKVGGLGRIFMEIEAHAFAMIV